MVAARRARSRRHGGDHDRHEEGEEQETWRREERYNTILLFRRSRSHVADEPTLTRLPPRRRRRRPSRAHLLSRALSVPARRADHHQPATSPIREGLGCLFPSTRPQPAGLRIGDGTATNQSTGETAGLGTPPPSRDPARRIPVSRQSQGRFLPVLLVVAYRARLRNGGLPACDGTLSLDEFNASAKALVAKWSGIDVDDCLPDWEWRPCRKMGVPSETEGSLVLEGVYRIGAGSQWSTLESNEDPAPDDVVEHDSWVQSSRDNVHLYDFHVVYSFSYKVPVLYFQGLQFGGQLLTLDEIKKDLPPHSLQLLNESKWTFITREEHPHLSRPWFTLHPCGTGDWMKLIFINWR